ncbi:DUF4349 domain-containing protein [Solitalea sp. MAHUQ-68]|uniref:DUF4349 domain-containing protein n=1 Tax=Solitalea agri TaxID=2953739 RepID=A0A9X2F087_9SPHI|nr:DUF4349 domain-containing protein [Solitalea agri]MCO4291735.1 DUF4349 domain-containing protein [Solitalea agri]
MKNVQKLLIVVLSASAMSCGEGKHPENYEGSADSASAVSSSAATETANTSGRRFVRSSELKFKVKNVTEATYKIEDITNRNGGFVTLTNLNSNVDYTNTTKVSADSSVESKYVTVTNEMTIRVPNTKLDTTLKDIAKLVDFLDYRIIKADDVSLQLLSNNLTQQRITRNERRLTNAIDNRGKKLNETSNAEETLLNKQEEADNAKISNLNLEDQINFSTVQLSIYQRQLVKQELIANQENIRQYEPGFFSKAKESFITGFEILSDLIVFIIRLWALILLAVIAFILYKRYGYKLRKEV